MMLILLSFAWVLIVAIWWDMEHQIGRMDAALRASAYLDRVLPAQCGEVTISNELLEDAIADTHGAPFNPIDVTCIHAAEGTGTYLAEADAVAILMGRATAGEDSSDVA